MKNGIKASLKLLYPKKKVAWFSSDTKIAFADGKNLDALYDCLTDMPSELTVSLENVDCLRDALGDYADSLLLVLQNGCASVCMK